MQKITIFTLLSLFIFSSCSQDESFKVIDKELPIETVTIVDEAKSDSIVEFNEADFPRIKKKPKTKSSYNYVDIWSELYQLNGLDFFIQSTNYNYGNNTLEATWAGSELKLSPYSAGNVKQKFRLKFLPATSGIPYLIYSSALNLPIGVGSYSNAPNKYVVFTKLSAAGSLFGFSWDFYLNDKTDAYIIENQDLIGGGSSWWDIYYYSITATNGALSMTRRGNSIDQQFVLIPDDNFEIQEIELQHNRGTILSSKPVVLDENGISNFSSTDAISHQFVYKKTRTDQSSFTEQNSVSTKKSGGFNIGVTIAKVVTIGGNASLEKGQQQTLTYGTNKTMSTEISKSYSFVIPPRSRVVYTFTAFQHELNVPYVATMKGVKSGKIIKLRGEWKGVDYSLSELRLDAISLDNPSKKMSPIYAKAIN